MINISQIIYFADRCFAKRVNDVTSFVFCFSRNIFNQELLNILSSAIGSLTNPTKLSASFKSIKQKTISNTTIKRYIDYLCDSFLIDSAVRYDIKGKKYIDTPVKYYFTDLGLRNARLNFRQLEETHTMENIIFNELKIRGFKVDVGVIILNTTNEKVHGIRRQLEIDFVCNRGSKRYYIQSAYAIPDEAKMEQEKRSLMLTGDFFKKIIITKDAPAPYYNDDGVLVMSVYDFLLNEDSLDIDGKNKKYILVDGRKTSQVAG